MRFTKWTQIENIQFKFTKHCDNKYSHAHQVLNTAYSNPLNSIEYLLLDDTITEVAPGSASIIKGEIAMVNSLATDNNAILRITNLFNKWPIYTTNKECGIQTLGNDGTFKIHPQGWDKSQ